MIRLLVFAGLLVVTTGCFSFSPEMIEALAKDQASFCGKVQASGGAGSITALSPTGGYGSGSLAFCRSNQPNAKVTMTEDSISIEHGEIEKK